MTGTRAASGTAACPDVAFSARAGQGGDPGGSKRLLQTVGQPGTGDGCGGRLLRPRHPRWRLETSSRPRHRWAGDGAGSWGALLAGFSRGQGSPLPTPRVQTLLWGLRAWRKRRHSCLPSNRAACGQLPGQAGGRPTWAA